MSKTALVTGGTGQDGSYLIDLLLAKGYVVHAQSRKKLDYDHYKGRVQWHVGNLTESVFLETLITGIGPDETYNLAAISRPMVAWNDPAETALINALVPQQICDLLRKVQPQARFFQASSCEMFGVNSDALQNEQTPCNPRSPYGIAKLYAHQIMGAYRQHYGLHLSSGILFNHESPRRPLGFVSQKIAHAVAALHLGLTDTSEKDERGQPLLAGGKLKLGDLEARRDFGFAGEYMEIIYKIVQDDQPDDYVIGSGENHSIAEFCKTAFGVVGLDWKDHVVVDTDLVRRVDTYFPCADITKLRNRFNWTPRTSFKELVTLMVNQRIENIRRASSPV